MLSFVDECRASGELGWQFFLPARTRWTDPHAKKQGR